MNPYEIIDRKISHLRSERDSHFAMEKVLRAKEDWHAANASLDTAIKMSHQILALIELKKEMLEQEGGTDG